MEAGRVVFVPGVVPDEVNAHLVVSAQAAHCEAVLDFLRVIDTADRDLVALLHHHLFLEEVGVLVVEVEVLVVADPGDLFLVAHELGVEGAADEVGVRHVGEDGHVLVGTDPALFECLKTGVRFC